MGVVSNLARGWARVQSRTPTKPSGAGGEKNSTALIGKGGQNLRNKPWIVFAAKRVAGVRDVA